MIYEADINVKKKLYSMFEDLDDTAILSGLQGHMGKVWVDDLEKPTAGQILVGIFVFFAGNPHTEGAQELLRNLPEHVLAIVPTEAWKKQIESVHQESVEKLTRYNLRKNPDDLDLNHLRTFLAQLPDGYKLTKIDEGIAFDPSLQEVSEDFTAQFESIEDFLERGIGYAIVHEGSVVCGAASYSIYDEGIEIEIATHPDHRRKGLATVAAAALIIDCLENGLYPSWDAANPESLTLAKKLGYVFEKAYDTYYIHTKS